VEVEDNAEENKEDKKKHSLKSETPIIVYECGDKVIAYHNKDIFMKYFKVITHSFPSNSNIDQVFLNSVRKRFD